MYGGETSKTSSSNTSSSVIITKPTSVSIAEDSDDNTKVCSQPRQIGNDYE